MNTLYKILVVDDQPVNIRLLVHLLGREGMEVITASSGQECLHFLETKHPDLVLLDIMMPGMDGMEVCRRIREGEATRDTPVIFITAKTNREGRLAGLQIGADDYITKPIDLEETLARVRTQLRIRENHRRNLELQSRLAESRHNAAIAAMTQGLAHNLNNLLGVVIGYLDLLRNSAHQPDKVLRGIGQMENAIKRMIGIIRQLTTLATTNQVRLSPHPLASLLQGGIDRLNPEQRNNCVITIEDPFPGMVLMSNAEVFEDAFGRLLNNAFESYPKEASPEQRSIHIVVSEVAKNTVRRLHVRIEDRGKGLDPDMEKHLFEPFVSTDTAVGRGLGLTVARHGARLLGGDVTLENRPEGGAVARLIHPV